jgi:energy-coupling factor transporter ATP-binding protein EcfA2
MLDKIEVKNLACYDETGCSINLSQETIFVGSNNSGKSTILTGLNLLRQHFCASFSWETPYYSLANFPSSVHNHDENKAIAISVSLGSNTYEIHSKANPISAKAVDSTGKPLPMPAAQLRKIWYLRPNRALLPYLSDVSPTTGGPLQPLYPDGSNAINFLVERFTDRDDRWDMFEEWLKKIDPDISTFKPPIRGRSCSFETLMGNVSINASLQGSGFQSAASIIASLIFSPKDATIIIEEPEVFLHKDSQEVLADLFNYVVSSSEKQVILSTHSWDMLLPFASDIAVDMARRGGSHVRAVPEKFKMVLFQKSAGVSNASEYPLATKTWVHFKEDMKRTLG